VILLNDPNTLPSMSSDTLPPGLPDMNNDGVVDEKDLAMVLDRIGRSWLIVLALGLATIAAGIVCLAWPKATLVVVGAILGIYLIVSGIVQVVQCFSREGGAAGMRVLLGITGGLSIILGFLCFRSVSQNLTILGIFIGVGWLLQGIAMIISGVSTQGAPGRVWTIAFGVISTIAGGVMLAWPIDSLQTLIWVVAIFLLVIGIAQCVVAFVLRGKLKDVTASLAS